MGNNWQERRDFHPVDYRLRLFGFRVYSRPRSGEAIWTYNGRLFGEGEAVLYMDRKEAEVKKILEGD